ncbi:MAG TPA: ABC transporter permease [Thermotogota bacterium]|nr:ABC transporter permease [Thermotogota bacterium]HPJ89013.1 ABC transporter permease [Thermotogota bacterium]HPR95524.1 ABC transporter permease [Thermotogota bacterium]
MEIKKLIRKFCRNPLNIISFFLFIFILFTALFPSIIAPYDPLEMDYNAFMTGPDSQHWFGTDQFGRDILSRIVFGVQKSMQIAFLAILLASFAGTTLGLLAGYFGKWVDQIIMRIIDAMFAFPSIILALFIIALFGASVNNLIIALGIVYTPIFARTIRGSTISLKQQLYVLAGKALGKGDINIIIKEIIPNLGSILIVTFTTNFSTALLSEATLGFLGLGVPPPEPTLGGMIGSGSDYLMSAPWVALFPGLIIAVIVLSINIIGDGLRDTLDPRNIK